MTDLSLDELKRYARHTILPEVGLAGQAKLKASSVLLVGAGGLGSPLALYLAAAGVGCIGLVDDDKVDVSNLQRQILHGESDVGRLKTDSARDRLREINPHLQLDTWAERLTAANAHERIEPYDIVIDGTDNFPTRYLVNDACVLFDKPNVYGSIFRFEGQASFFHPAGGGPCYRCLFPEPPAPGTVPSCAEGGVFGVLPGLIGSIQATEAIKFLLGIGELLRGRLLLYSALDLRFREIKLKRDANCPVCGDSPSITRLMDMPSVCELPPAASGIRAISVQEFHALRKAGTAPALLDVREEAEVALSNMSADIHIPLGQLPERMAELDAGQPLVVHCKSGARSARAVEFLQERGFRDVLNLTGGILAWKQEVDFSQ